MDGPERMEFEALIEQARAAREGRDRWRRVGPILRKLRDLDVSWREITALTGIPQATGYRMLGRARLSSTSVSTRPTGTP